MARHGAAAAAVRLAAVCAGALLAGARGQCGGNTTADNVTAGVDLSGRVAIVTGGDSELGVPVVRALARQGASVVIASHNLSKCQALARELAAETGGKVEAMALDLTSFASVRAFADQFLAEYGAPLHMLIHNAGIDNNPPNRTVDGYQMLFQVNYLAPFLLTELLLPALRASGTPDNPARLVNVGSTEHEIACEAAGWPEGCLSDFMYLPPPQEADHNVTIHYPDGGTEVRNVELYGFTKLLHIEHAREVARREAATSSPVWAGSLTPGWVNTSLTRGIPVNSSIGQRKCAAQRPNPCPFTPDEGAAITAFLAVRAPLAGSGAYFSRIAACQEWPVTWHGFQEDSMGPELYERSLRWAGLQSQGASVVV